jgi:hypothetical protein
VHAAHFAAALAIKGRVPQAPTWALLTGAFVPDLLWVPLAMLGVEPTAPAVFFDDWSHSLATTVLWATLWAALFWRRGRVVAAAAWIAVFSHFLLDMPIHPQPLALYPHSILHLGFSYQQVSTTVYWWVQLAVLVALSLVYVQAARRHGAPLRLVAASCLVMLSLHLLLH